MKKKGQKKTVRHAAHSYTVILESDEGGYHAFCPALSGCHTCGDTLEDALENIRDAVRLYCKSLRARSERLPEENYIITWVRVSV
jgi:predicted RNase H-like HicB family nuclease